MVDGREYIKWFDVEKLWNRVDIHWDNVYPDVNILVGINGCGKTTLLNLISDFYSGKKNKPSIVKSVNGSPIDMPVTFIHSFDVPANAKRKTESMLLQDLKNIVNQNGEGTSFFDYRMRMLNYPQEADVIQSRISRFFELVDSMFGETGKRIKIDPQNNAMVFSVASHVYGETRIQLDQLSSGEKQLLLILTTVFLQNEAPSVLLMDEPEISLHISWQDKLVSTLRELNPNCQLILTTHSPSIFADGWEDRIVFMEDIERGSHE